jgi:membrane protein implicated in regulation of membrane protease activity
MFVFIALAVIGILLVAVSAFLGHDFDAHPELEVGGIGFFSLRALSIFIMTFGTVGALVRWTGRTPVVSSFWGALAGVLMYALYVVAMQMIRSQQASSLIEDSELVGLTALVTVAIPAEGLGEVTCRLKSQTTRRMARTRGREAIGEGKLVRVSELQGDVLLVEPAN